MASEVTARAKWIRMSAYKAREAAQLIRGKSIDEARRILAFTPKASARAVSKVLESAVANAEHNFQIPQEELFVKIASADEGVTIKRFRPRAQGRGYRIRKRTCHINLTLERAAEAPPSPRPRRAQSAGAAQAPADSRKQGRSGAGRASRGSEGGGRGTGESARRSAQSAGGKGAAGSDVPAERPKRPQRATAKSTRQADPGKSTPNEEGA